MIRQGEKTLIRSCCYQSVRVEKIKIRPEMKLGEYLEVLILKNQNQGGKAIKQQLNALGEIGSNFRFLLWLPVWYFGKFLISLSSLPYKSFCQPRSCSHSFVTLINEDCHLICFAFTYHSPFGLQNKVSIT